MQLMFSPRAVFIIVPLLVAVLALFLSSIISSKHLWKGPISLWGRKLAWSSVSSSPATNMASRLPVYFLSHGGPNVQYETQHPAYPVLQKIGREITQKVKPKAVVVFSAHWQSEKPNTIQLNNAEKTDLIYDFHGFPKSYYQATYPSCGSPTLAARVVDLLAAAGIRASGLKRGLDHGVFSGFNVAFDPATNPLGCPLVQVSLFASEDPDAHYRLGRAVAPLRDESVLVICTGMTVHNLRDIAASFFSPDVELVQPAGRPRPLPYAERFDAALRLAVEGDAEGRQDRMRAVCATKDARLAHPWMDHLMPLYITAGAAGDDRGIQTWTLREGCLAWGQYRFGDLPGEGAA